MRLRVYKREAFEERFYMFIESRLKRRQMLEVEKKLAREKKDFADRKKAALVSILKKADQARGGGVDQKLRLG